MDSDFHGTPGLGLPSPSTGQSGPIIASNNSAQPDSGVSHSSTAMQLPSDDNSEELDQEWVNKAKSIVEQTKDDPFKESRELSKIKADYLKTRYNKHIKVSEDQA